jgi:glycosyltransferase involved in cell wall biosynthesis
MKIKKKGIILSCSDFFSDVIPAFLFCKKFNWYAFSYHLYPKKISLRSLFGRFLQFFSYLLFNYSSKVFVTNQICENFLKKNFRIKNLKKISLGIDLEKFFRINKSQKVRENLLFLGRFKESKGFFEIPEILLYLNKNNPNFFLNLIGSGSESDINDFMKKIQEYKLESKVSIHTKLSDFEVLNFLQTSNILIHPSFEEGFSLAICEALASNLKVCAYNLPIYKEIYSDFGIVTCATHNTKSFAKNIEKCLKSSEKTNYPQEYFEDFDFDKTYNLIFN